MDTNDVSSPVYVVLGAGGLAVVGGVGLICYSGVKAIAGLRKPKRIIVQEPLLLEGGPAE